MDEKIKYDDESIIFRLKTRFAKDNINYDKLFQILKENKAYIIGSYLLNSICETDYPDHFFRILISNDSKSEFLENQFNELFSECKKMTLFFTYKYCLNIKEYIDSFNINIYCNYYDGDTLYIKDLNSIINKSAEFNAKYEKYNDFILGYQDLIQIKSASSTNFNFKLIFSNNNIYDLILNNNIYDGKKVALLIWKLDMTLELIDKLPYYTENILVYFYNLFDNYSDEFDLSTFILPPLLKEIRFFGMNKYTKTLKLPYGCELYINNEKITL